MRNRHWTDGSVDAPSTETAKPGLSSALTPDCCLEEKELAKKTGESPDDLR
jgi:hypothetical protein